MWLSSEQDPLCTSPNEESAPLANNAPLKLPSGTWYGLAVDATLGGVIIQRADEILFGPSCLKMANSSDLRRARQFRGWHATCSEDCAHCAFAPLVALPIQALTSGTWWPRDSLMNHNGGIAAKIALPLSVVMVPACWLPGCVPFFALQACFEGAFFRFR